MRQNRFFLIVSAVLLLGGLAFNTATAKTKSLSVGEKAVVTPGNLVTCDSNFMIENIDGNPADLKVVLGKRVFIDQMINPGERVAYSLPGTIAAGVLFQKWDDECCEEIFTSHISDVEDYVPGEFYKRELPCVLKLLADHEINPDCIVIDGLVYLDGRNKAGLGKHLFDALAGEISVIGVAKQSFKDITAEFEVYRGGSEKPLFVTSVGVETATAKRWIAHMHGAFRVPTLLKKVDQVCRGHPC